METIDIILFLLGILYTIIWSSSFYFQIALNYKVKHSDGYSLNFQFFNFFGFAYYSVSSWHYLIVQKADIDSIIDLAFALHGFVITIVILGQTFYYPRIVNRLNSGAILILLITIVMSVVYYFLNINVYDGKTSDTWIFIGLSKALLSLVKYLYQIFLNYDRKSTHGFSIINVILDMTGGITSLIQVILKILWYSEEVFGDKTNIPKMALSVVVLLFDLILIYQHYGIYRGRDITAINMDSEVMKKTENLI